MITEDHVSLVRMGGALHSVWIIYLFFTFGGAGAMTIPQLWFGAGGCVGKHQLWVHVSADHGGKPQGDVWRPLISCSKTQVLGEPFSTESREILELVVWSQGEGPVCGDTRAFCWASSRAGC